MPGLCRAAPNHRAIIAALSCGDTLFAMESGRIPGSNALQLRGPAFAGEEILEWRYRNFHDPSATWQRSMTKW